MSRSLFLFVLNFVFALGLESSAFAKGSGTGAGDGGHGVVCPGKPIELLDLYEARTQRGWASEYFVGDYTATQFVAIYRDRVAQILPAGHPFLAVFDRAQLLLESMIVDSQVTAPTLDAGLINLEPGCWLRQVAVRTEFGTDSVHVVTVDVEFWAQASPQVKALLVLHEAMHEWFVKSETDWIPTTAPIRYLIGYLGSGELLALNESALRKLIENR